MKSTKFVAKSSTSKLFIGKDGEIISDHNKAMIYDTIGDCMRACVEANENLGKAAFKICQISVDTNEDKNVV